LAIVRHLVELHGGTVSVDSPGIGQGATFTVRIPRGMRSPAAVPAQHSHAERAEYPPELQGMRVLVVDDQPDILELVEEMLLPCGAEIRVCNRADDALAVLQIWRPDVLVSDIAMPGHDGYWLIEHLRALPAEQGGETPAVALTAYVRVEERARVLAAGFNMYVPKPIDQAELRSVVAGLTRPAW
jgi:CheY-like chemotaxis protein